MLPLAALSIPVSPHIPKMADVIRDSAIYTPSAMLHVSTGAPAIHGAEQGEINVITFNNMSNKKVASIAPRGM